jgi:hypothetical protein
MRRSAIYQILYSALRLHVQTQSGEFVQATGFMIRLHNPINQRKSKICLITNKHVVSDALKIFFQIHHVDDDGNRLYSYEKFELEVEIKRNVFLHPNADLAVVLIGECVRKHRRDTKKKLFCIPIQEKSIYSDERLNRLNIIEDIVMPGFANEFRDPLSKLPVIRKGTTASPSGNNWNNEPVFITDLQIEEGASGSPIFLLDYNNIALIGVAKQSIRYTLDLLSSSDEVAGTVNVNSGMGYAVKSNQIFYFHEVIFD